MITLGLSGGCVCGDGFSAISPQWGDNPDSSHGRSTSCDAATSNPRWLKDVPVVTNAKASEDTQVWAVL